MTTQPEPEQHRPDTPAPDDGLRERYAAAIRAKIAAPDARPTEPEQQSCRSEEGITVGLVDAVIGIIRVLAPRDMSSENVQDALADLFEDSDFRTVRDARQIDTAPNRCACPCEGCKHNCGAHGSRRWEPAVTCGEECAEGHVYAGRCEQDEPDNPAAWALARHIADHPMITVMAAMRYLNALLTLELHETDAPADTPAEADPFAGESGCGTCGGGLRTVTIPAAGHGDAPGADGDRR